MGKIPTFRIYTKARLSYSLTIRDGKVVLARSNPNDLFQHWFKEEKFGTRVKDVEGFPGFALVNKATALAIKHVDGEEPVQLIPYNPHVLDKSILWTESKDYYIHSFREIRKLDNIKLTLGTETEHISDGTGAGIYRSMEGDNHQWNLTMHDDSGSGLASEPTAKICVKRDRRYCLTTRDGEVVLTLSNSRDKFQHWIKDERYGRRVKDEEGSPSFALVNKATGQAITYSTEEYSKAKLVPYNPNVVDKSLLWTESKDLGDGFRYIRIASRVQVVLDAYNGHINDGTVAGLYPIQHSDNEMWKIAPYRKRKKSLKMKDEERVVPASASGKV